MKTNTCHECGHTAKVYVHKLNQSMVSALKQLVKHYEATNKPAKLQDDLNLTQNQYNNFQKLQYFGVVTRDSKGWTPTSLGIWFSYGQALVYDRAATLNGLPLSLDHEYWLTSAKQPRAVSLNNIGEITYKRAEEYAQGL